MVSGIDDPLLRRGVELAIDGTDPDELAAILDAEVDAARARGTIGAKLFSDMGAYAPTLGIIGTVLGLVQVLNNLSDPGELGHLIAGAFVATLWGVLSANVLWLPIGNKLTVINRRETQQRRMVVEGVLAIQSGANPRVVDRRLRALLPLEAARPASKAA
jgi:chemotaxis protein MotA